MSRKWISNLKGLGDNSALLAGFGPHLLKQALALCRALPRPFGNPGSIGSGHHVASSPSLLSPGGPHDNVLSVHGPLSCLGLLPAPATETPATILRPSPLRAAGPRGAGVMLCSA